jgi:hypothetical protein
VYVKSAYYHLHVLAWLYMTGELPKQRLLHINGDRTDNRFANLTTHKYARTPLTHAELVRLIHYDPATGVFTRLTQSATSTKPGTIVRDKGALREGRPHVRFMYLKNTRYPQHRIAWFYMTGEWPEHLVDHINGNPHDNRWSNLRAATPSQNSMNCRKAIDNRSGYKGIHLRGDGKAWKAQIICNGRHYYLGCFRDKEAAVAAYREAALRLHGEFARFE